MSNWPDSFKSKKLLEENKLEFLKLNNWNYNYDDDYYYNYYAYSY